MISSTPRPYYWAKYSWHTNADDNYASVKVTDPCGLVIKTYENVASNRILATAFSDSLNKELALQAKNINPPCPTESPYVTIPPQNPNLHFSPLQVGDIPLHQRKKQKIV